MKAKKKAAERAGYAGLLAQPVERPTPELARRGVVEPVETAVGGVEAVALKLGGASAVSRLERAGRLDPKQVKAAVRLFADWHRAKMEPLSRSSLADRVGGSGGLGLAEVRVAARDDYHGACRVLELLHPGCRTVVEALVIHGETVEGAGQQVSAGYRHPRVVGARAQALLEVGLWQLAVHYGYA